MSYHNRPLMILTLAGALLALTACGGSTALPQIEVPPPSLTEPCQAPMTLPAREASQVEVERWWGADRARLVECGSRHDGLAGWAAAISGSAQAPD